MSTIKLDKIKSIFSGEQKEKLITQDGKRNLYFDRNRKSFIKFILDVKTTCSTIKKNYKEEINKKLKEIYGSKVNSYKFAFFIVELLANKFETKPKLIDLKIGMDDTILFNLLQNKQLMLCYMPVTEYNRDLKKSLKSLILMSSIENKNEKTINKGKNDQVIIVFLPKTVIHYYIGYKKAFSKEKIKITEKEIYIFSRLDKSVLIKDIVNINIFLSDEEEKAKKYFENYVINGEKPKYCIEIKTSKNDKILIGRNTLEHFITLNRAIESAIIFCHNRCTNKNLNEKLIEENNDLMSTHKFIVEGVFTINDLVINKEKRKILFKDFNEVNLANIVDNIIEFKSFFKKKQYNQAINKIKNIWEIINEKMTKEELDKYQKIINKERIEQIEDINKKIKEICGEDNNIDEDEKNIIELQKIININMFDYLYLEIKDEYLSKYYEENNYVIKKNNDSSISNNFKIIQNTKLLLGHYFTNIFNINKEKDVLLLGGPEVEETAKDYNDKLFQAKMSKHYVI